ncbi:MAG: hypothetical protein GWO20_08335 [Candidatus Korarchaeota archaeon]|nr:hypothetical protein [Candidatus Korarchaeota archaeon]NIU82024.1 hypothetical protein [Candidatus Thorarchaeota archaeon]NIW13848.1 hypothetical protein [Candidatus Thorarchaeota archaeon]NIW51959.1 hypothetical protein [Candidatus Korarchaeota archaeon]
MRKVTSVPHIKVEKIKQYVETLYYKKEAKRSPHAIKACKILGFIEDSNKLTQIGKKFAKTEGVAARQVFYEQASRWKVFSQFMDYLRDKKRLAKKDVVDFFETTTGKNWNSKSERNRIASIIEDVDEEIKEEIERRKGRAKNLSK